jgi:N-acetylglucosamine-1-phosphodiester alpha-N-acetylglucosaminidase
LGASIGFLSGAFCVLSVTARSENCIYATNAGFFAMTTPSACEGNLIINGTAVQLPALVRANFGLTREGKYVVGFITEADLKRPRWHFTQLIQGVGWIVRDGASYVAKSPDLSQPFIDEKAPRTALGIMPDGECAWSCLWRH